jgi:hypothetical protein
MFSFRIRRLSIAQIFGIYGDKALVVSPVETVVPE